MDVAMRILTSQKFWTSVVGAVSVVLLNVTGVDYTGALTTAVTSLTGILVAVQGFLDHKHGSKSDGTGEFAPPPQS